MKSCLKKGLKEAEERKHPEKKKKFVSFDDFEKLKSKFKITKQKNKNFELPETLYPIYCEQDGLLNEAAYTLVFECCFKTNQTRFFENNPQLIAQTISLWPKGYGLRKQQIVLKVNRPVERT